MGPFGGLLAAAAHDPAGLPSAERVVGVRFDQRIERYLDDQVRVEFGEDGKHVADPFGSVMVGV